MALNRSLAPPTAGLEVPDPACDLDYTPVTAKAMPGVRFALNNVMAFAGNNVSLLFEAA